MDKEEKIKAMIKYIKDKYNCSTLYTIQARLLWRLDRILYN